MTYFLIYLISLVFIIFIIDWIAKKKVINQPFARKLTHIITGLVVCSFPFLLNSLQIIVLSGIFLVLMAIARINKMLIMNHVERVTWGEVYFPAAVGICAFISLPENANAYFIGILSLTFADAIANVIGNLLPLKVIKIGSQTKSVGGFMACVIMVFIIFAMFFTLSIDTWYILLGLSIIVGFVEMVSIYGTDNLTVPATATLFTLLINGWIN